jgi:hypothetical protein
VCRGKEKIEGCGRYLKKRVIYIYMSANECAIRKQKKNLLFKHSVRRGKTNSSKENFSI